MYMYVHGKFGITKTITSVRTRRKALPDPAGCVTPFSNSFRNLGSLPAGNMEPASDLILRLSVLLVFRAAYL